MTSAMIQSSFAALMTAAILWVAATLNEVGLDIARLQEQLVSIKQDIARNEADTGEWRGELLVSLEKIETRVRAIETMRRSSYGDIGGSGLRAQ